ncbi:tetratricopeptide repeat protein [Glaciihabitans tibetensis]|uniref:Tetratricopeptide repeat protein n=1 Tax=Glaciihabitans tibetensis TaxID=1266600 RepID=A0A2T0VIQ5_9MICO|nr:tetratricopeptide repeat protein [Glaciihabitans tibetensis]PRY70102.1 tetratricopeptide repeat protein [Glaciihabitans tibetensis]
MTEEWQSRVALVWATASRSSTSELLGRIDELVEERPDDDATALFEAASARDYIGEEAAAEPLYRRSLALGLDEPLRGRAVIQLASTLRNLGRPDEAITILQDGFANDADHRLIGSARAFLALCLADTGDERAAIAVALDALADHLAEYSGSVRAYAAQLIALE